MKPTAENPILEIVRESMRAEYLLDGLVDHIQDQQLLAATVDRLAASLAAIRYYTVHDRPDEAKILKQAQSALHDTNDTVVMQHARDQLDREEQWISDNPQMTEQENFAWTK